MRHDLVDASPGGRTPRGGNHEHWNWKKFSCECSQNFVASYRQIFHSPSDRIEDRIGDCGNRGNLARFADALRAIGPITVVALDKYDLDLRRVTVSHDPVAVKSTGERLPVSPVVNQIFVQRHADPHDGAAFNLASCR